MAARERSSLVTAVQSALPSASAARTILSTYAPAYQRLK